MVNDTDEKNVTGHCENHLHDLLALTVESN
jgi:hypothetical protein